MKMKMKLPCNHQQYQIQEQHRLAFLNHLQGEKKNQI